MSHDFWRSIYTRINVKYFDKVTVLLNIKLSMYFY